MISLLLLPLLAALTKVQVQDLQPLQIPMVSRLVRSEEAVPTLGPWGHWRRYFRSDTPGAKDMTILAVTLKPGQKPHPPHRHAEEEFMIVTEGTGIWHLDKKEFPARPGDVIYAAPGIMHGLKNTSETSLTYYIVKWAGTRVNSPQPLATEVKQKKPTDNSLIQGKWNTIDRHIAMGSLYQPVHGVRKREGAVYFQQERDKLIGHSVTKDHEGISFQERWKNGHTNFRTVEFADNRLAFEFEIGEWRKGAGPLAVEEGRAANQGKVRVEAVLKDNRLVGWWRMYLGDGTEVFRGEWEAVRQKVLSP